jgi:hypothetical protein
MRKRIVVLEPIFAVRSFQEMLPDADVPRVEIGAQTRNPIFEGFEARNVVLELGPTRKTVLPRNDQLCVGE